MSVSEESFDVVVVGSGGGGLIGAYTAASRGLRTLLIEKTDKVGGTTSYSGGGSWYPGSAPLLRSGIGESDLEAARTYLRAVVDDASREDLQDAYLAAGAQLIDELEKNQVFGQFDTAPVPDYFGTVEGATLHGRTVFPAPVPVAEIGEHADIVRRSIYTERYGHTEDEILIGGRALIGRALKAFLETGNGTLKLNTALTELVVEDGRIVGVEATTDGQSVRYRAGRGVLLATGGFEHNTELRAKYDNYPLKGDWSDAVGSNVGDGHVAGIAVGADTELMDEAWYISGVVQRDGLPLFNVTRGGIWVNGAGQRFTNEAAPYDQVGRAIRAGDRTTGVSHAPTHWIFDHKQLARDGFGGKSPDTPVDEDWFTSGTIKRADTLEELAAIIGVPADALTESVAKFNGFVPGGVDEQFHRGESAWDQMVSFIVGYPALPEQAFVQPIEPEGPNSLLVKIDTPPYYAATILPSDIGTKGGLKTDTKARVLRADGTVIDGLYATGNTMAAMSGTVYPGAGTPVGSTLAFAYLAARDIAGD